MEALSPAWLSLGLAFSIGFTGCAPEHRAPPPATASSAQRLPPRRDAEVPSPPPALSDEQRLTASFLTQEDVGKDKTRVDEGPARPDRSFRDADGQRAYFVRWVDPGSAEVVRRVEETHWVFPSEVQAGAFFRARAADSDRRELPIVTEAPPVGSESRTYTGMQAHSGPVQDQYTFLFREGRVVAEISVTRGAKSPVGSLTSAKAGELARAAASRIADAFWGGAAASPPGASAGNASGPGAACPERLVAAVEENGGMCLEPSVVGAAAVAACEDRLAKRGWRRDDAVEGAIGAQTGKKLVCFGRAR